MSRFNDDKAKMQLEKLNGSSNQFYSYPQDSYIGNLEVNEEYSLQKMRCFFCSCCKIQEQTKITKQLVDNTHRPKKLFLKTRFSSPLLPYQHLPQYSFNFYLFSFFMWLLVIGPALNPIICYYLRISPGLLFGAPLSYACHPGSKNGGNTRFRPALNLNPFQMNEFFPKMSEQTIGASGPAEGPIYLDSERYRTEIIPNFNPDIVFEDEERTNEDRMMTQRCKDRLDMLAIWVINQWPGVKLRVTEGWNDPSTDRADLKNALHYEGRAVDITTNDQDPSKYPVLARLAVEAGFDWVHLQPTYVHCSVKSDSSPASVNGGCFPGDSPVPVPGGSILRLDHLRPGDEVYSVDLHGNIVPDRILSFLDVKKDKNGHSQRQRMFISIKTANGNAIRLTRNHLIYILDQKISDEFNLNKNLTSLNFKNSAISTFAVKVKPGDFIFITHNKNSTIATVRPVLVVEVNHVVSASGAYAPLTNRGTIVIGNSVASCYAVIESHTVAHIAMSPLRYYYSLRDWFARQFLLPASSGTNITNNECIYQSSILNPYQNSTEVSFYARLLFALGQRIIPKSIFMET